MNKTISPELYHYGIKGMKWGVRKDDKRKGRNNRSSTKLDTIESNFKQRISSGKAYIQSLKQAFEEGVNEELARQHIAINTQNMQNNWFNNMTIQQANDFAMQEATRNSINASMQAASLSISGGTNPFMFGMM